MSEQIRIKLIPELIDKVIEKYKSDTGTDIPDKTTLLHWEGLAKELTKYSHEYVKAHEKKFGKFDPTKDKFDVTPRQVRNAYLEDVQFMKDYFYQACHKYVYGKEGDYSEFSNGIAKSDTLPGQGDNNNVNQDLTDKDETPVLVIASITITALIVASFWVSSLFSPNPKDQLDSLQNRYNALKLQYDNLKRVTKISSYQPSRAEIDSLEGIWKVITGSPQARGSDPDRFHKIVPNLIEVKYKDGFFTFQRYGPSLNQTGIMQFEFRNVISIHTYLNYSPDSISAVKHTIMRLEPGKTQLNVISASWNYDIASKSRIIGIREVYIKLGKGRLSEDVNDHLTYNNVHNPIKTMRWAKNSNKKDDILVDLSNQILDSFPDKSVKNLLDEKSVILKELEDTLIITKEMHERQRRN